MGNNQFTAVPMPEGLWSKVDKTGGSDACWPWTGKQNRKGYGAFHRKGYGCSAHQAAYILTYGDCRPLYVLHRCDNPPCCNPKHLFSGTQTENLRDMVEKGRHTPEETKHLGEAHGRAKLTDNNVRQIRRLHSEGLTYRQIAARFPVTRAMIGFIVRGDNWKHVL